LGALETVVDMAGNIAAVEETGGISPITPLEDGVGDTGRSEKWGDMLRTRREDGEEVDWRGLWSRGTDAVMDVPIGGVCEVLYGEGREREEWELGETGEGMENECA